MLSSIDWLKLRCFEYELENLKMTNDNPIMLEWLEKEISRLKEMIDDS